MGASARHDKGFYLAANGWLDRPGQAELIELQELSLDDLAERARRSMMRRYSEACARAIGP